MFIFSDIEKAYDTSWKYGIMKYLHYMDLRGRLYKTFYTTPLYERRFRVGVGTSISDFYDQEIMGVL